MSVGINSRDIDELHPTVARGCRELIRRMNAAGYAHVGVSSTYRDHTHQNWLFDQGRSRAGNIVTNARGGQSWHNWRLAFDIFQNIRGQEWNDSDFFATAGMLWTEMGGEWGGNWTNFPDRPHMQYTGGLTMADHRQGARLPEVASMLWEHESRPWEHESHPHPPPHPKTPPLPPWATDSTAWARTNGITDGTAPERSATRQEVWTMMHRLYNLVME